jgi:DNA-binding SARP family transcriptional activator
MFGEMSIQTENSSIFETDNRSKKVWLLLAYLIFHHDRIVKVNELKDILWSDSEKEKYSTSAIKTLLYRLRMELDKLWDGAGKQLILFSGNGYTWNNDFALHIDCEQFEQMYDRISKSQETEPDEAIEFLDLYNGEFLADFTMEFWVTPKTVYYHNIYIESLLRVLPILVENQRYDDVIRLCTRASASEPFLEEISWYWMKACVCRKQYKEAMEVYLSLRERFQDELGIVPSDELHAIYGEALKCSNGSVLSVEMVKDDLCERDSLPGALVCDYDFFRVLYQSMARSVLRSGTAVHLVLVTMREGRVVATDEKRWNKIYGNLQEVIRQVLRRGDTVASCSSMQYIIMLPRANYENSCKVSDRIANAFYRKNSRLDVELYFEVFSIQPDDKENWQWMKDPSEN